MFPVRERYRHLFMVLAVLLITSQIALLGIIVLNYKADKNFKPRQVDQISIANKKDNWELLAYKTNNTDRTDKKVETVQTVKVTEAIQEIEAVEEVENATKQKLGNLAEKYKADPEYLDYIVKVEKTFKLEPCELLALIAQESGFKPQTHMDGGSLSYSTTQMKMATAKTAHMAITEYYKMEIPYPTHELLKEDKHYAAFLAGGYLRYLHDTYKDKYESYTAYNWGIGGRMIFYKNNGHFKSSYAIKVASLGESFNQYVGKEYDLPDIEGQERIDPSNFARTIQTSNGILS